MHGSNWDDHHDYSWEIGPTNDLVNLSQEPIPGGSYAHPFQDMSYVPPSIEWSYETPSECSYVTPPPSPEVHSLEDVINKFIQSQNEFIKSQFHSF